jgi:hypothetical protein
MPCAHQWRSRPTWPAARFGQSSPVGSSRKPPSDTRLTQRVRLHCQHGSSRVRLVRDLDAKRCVQLRPLLRLRALEHPHKASELRHGGHDLVDGERGRPRPALVPSPRLVLVRTAPRSTRRARSGGEPRGRRLAGVVSRRAWVLTAHRAAVVHARSALCARLTVHLAATYTAVDASSQQVRTCDVVNEHDRDVCGDQLRSQGSRGGERRCGGSLRLSRR